MGMYSKYNLRIKEVIEERKKAHKQSTPGKIASIIIGEVEEDINFNGLKSYIKRKLPTPTLANVNSSSSKPNDYKQKFVLSAWNQNTGLMMDIDTYCVHYALPRKDISSYKLVSHTGTPYYNIVFKENLVEEVFEIDFEAITKKHIKAVKVTKYPSVNKKDYDMLTYTDTHIGMDTNKFNNSMYPVLWDYDSIMASAKEMVEQTLAERESSVLYIDELGDMLDGLHGKTTRGGHDLPQLMNNEEAYDCAFDFKMYLIDNLIPYYDKIYINNICNDNHAGVFGLLLNKHFKGVIDEKYPEVSVTNHKKFINHYFAGRTCFIITHGKDDISLKFGFKPFLDPKGSEKIDQYCKQNGIYKKADLIVFKKGDSHQALFDMCTSDDFFYFNYPALSPSSQWVQNNFKKGRRGFVNESFSGTKNYIKPNFITK